MAGGQGTRFWPLSRAAQPKQFLRLFGAKSLLRATAERLLPLVGWQRLLVVTHQRYAAAVRRELPELPAANVLAEPQARNTFPCLLFAAAWVAERDPHALLIVAPADHLIQPRSVFLRDVHVALQLAEQHPCLVTLGIRPQRPETGYGYIECGQPVGEGKGEQEAFWVRRFREKPDARTARRFVQSGKFFWNSGLFVWSLPSFVAAAETCVPGAWGTWRSVLGRGGRPQAARLRDLYREAPSRSVDVALLEPVASLPAAPVRVAVVPARFRWSDIGSWQELAELWLKDEHGNALQGRVVSVATKGCLAWSQGRLLALVGVNDLVVVETSDAVLVCHKEQTQSVRSVIAGLERRKWRKWL